MSTPLIFMGKLPSTCKRADRPSSDRVPRALAEHDRAGKRVEKRAANPYIAGGRLP